MSRVDKRQVFAAMERAIGRKSQMTQKAPKEQIPALLAELVNRESNLKTLALVERFLATVHVAGAEAVSDLSRCFAWLSGVSQGEDLRVKEIKALLPDQNAEIKMGPEKPIELPDSEPLPEPQDPESPEPAQAVAVGGVELGVGSPVFGPA